MTSRIGELVKTPEANVIKLPNISASVPQLVAAVKELQAQGYAIPDYPETRRPMRRRRRARFDAIKGSAVNPVLREGNSDRRAAKAVKEICTGQPAPHGRLVARQQDARGLHVGRRFLSNEVSATLDKAATAKIVLTTDNGEEIVLKDGGQLPGRDRRRRHLHECGGAG
jgi:isocitrate dehydrogenase